MLGGADILVCRKSKADKNVCPTKQGFCLQVLTRVFELFVQGNHATGCSQGGLGIGLTLVKSLVEMHGGSVAAASPGPGQGSEFIVRLPSLLDRTGPGDQETPPVGSQPDSVAAQRQILVVDDNVDAAESLATLLRLEGHVVRVAFNGPAALEAVRIDPPDVLFLDIGMDEMDGNAVARQIRQEPALAKVKLVAVTGWGQEEDRRQTREAGFDYHLVKPVDPRVLWQLLDE